MLQHQRRHHCVDRPGDWEGTAAAGGEVVQDPGDGGRVWEARLRDGHHGGAGVERGDVCCGGQEGVEFGCVAAGAAAEVEEVRGWVGA